MKFITIIFLLNSINSIAQIDTIYFDINWNECPKKSAAYYNITSLENKKIITKDYFISGQIQMIGEISSFITKIKNGRFKFYHQNGNIKSEGYYKNGNKEGEYKWYFDNGNIEAIENHINGKLNGKYIEYYINGNTNYIVNYKNDQLNGKAIYYHENGEKSQIGNFKNNQKTGKWDYWFGDGKYASYETYQSSYKIEDALLNIDFKNNKWHLTKPENTKEYTVYTFKRNPLKEKHRDVVPNISFMIEDVGESTDVITYSALKRMNIPFEVIEVLTFEKGNLSIKNSIGYIGSYLYENGDNHTIYVIHTINNKKGTQIIFDTTESTYKMIESEFKKVLKSIKTIE